jgi:hypothetical protein
MKAKSKGKTGTVGLNECTQTWMGVFILRIAT